MFRRITAYGVFAALMIPGVESVATAQCRTEPPECYCACFTTIPISPQCLPLCPTPSTQRKGLVINVDPKNTSDYNRALTDCRVRALEVRFNWSAIQTAQNTFDWSDINAFLDDCDTHDKRGVIEISFAGYDHIGSQVIQSTPSWYYGIADHVIENGSNPNSPGYRRYPAFWDGSYLMAIDTFIMEFAQEFAPLGALDSRIEYFRIGGWSVGTNEPSFYPNNEFLDLWPSIVASDPNGWGSETFCNNNPSKLILDNDNPYADAVSTMLAYWSTYFDSLYLGATIHFPIPDEIDYGFNQRMTQDCVNDGIMMMNTGLNNKAKSGARTQLAAWRSQGVKVAWGGVTLNDNNEPPCCQDSSPVTNNEAERMLQMMKNGIGTTGSCFSPKSHVSYITVAPHLLDYCDAWNWALPRLEE